MDGKRREEGPAKQADGVGLCADCRHARTQRGRGGRDFWRCGLAEHDPAFPRYPRLPVRECGGFGGD